MGLDMYLSASLYVSEYGDKGKQLSAAIRSLLDNAPGTGKGDNGSVQSIQLRIGYWRKANHIHQWFVQNVQGGADKCEEHSVGREQLKSLLAVCTEVQADPAKGPELLPTQSGFFFGSTEYDECYMDYVLHTIKVAERALIALDSGYDITYRSSW